jgi:hypothetical protein
MVSPMAIKKKGAGCVDVEAKRLFFFCAFFGRRFCSLVLVPPERRGPINVHQREPRKQERGKRRRKQKRKRRGGGGMDFSFLFSSSLAPFIFYAFTANADHGRR